MRNDAIMKMARGIRPYRYSPLFRMLHPRRFHAFCVGTDKSGTHAIAQFFQKNFRSAHEKTYGEAIELALKYRDKKISREGLWEGLRRRDKYAWLEMDASHNHGLYIGELVECFPAAKFILTIRDCISWVDSHFNQCMNFQEKQGSPWIDYHDHRFNRDGKGFEYEEEDAPLKKHGFYSLDSYFRGWNEHNQSVIDVIPEDRLLILRTFDLSSSATRIADFMGISKCQLSDRKEKIYAAPQKHKILAQLNPTFVRSKARQSCSELMTEFFPEVDIK
jgi:hypothetical protein